MSNPSLNPTLSLSLITYDRGPHPLTNTPRPHHWAYFLDTGTERGTIFQLRGMPGGFYYPGPEDLDMAQGGEVGGVVGKLEVGELKMEVEGDGVEGVVEVIHGVLKGVPVVVDESAEWNCQDWALEGLEGLKGVGVVHEELGRERVKAWLKERW
ncbi:hypothetical protein F5144DRAFT_632562 [Chaetomium tenue]|uniref:Uncharacterized protein n=1 Tax=Chaetomium tenue TaxID=1854479 RepID=A0ACB7NZS9_9PEZI|nr:hypothetical protein F5144DRAFT_632562 [Chaetomium globosum]